VIFSLLVHELTPSSGSQHSVQTGIKSGGAMQSEDGNYVNTS
jgi:hypothetical protein